MTIDVRARQARAAALGFDPGPIDGVDGRRTQEAVAKAANAQGKKGLPFIHASGITRIHLHWSGGPHKPSALDRKHYHVLIHGDGSVEWAHQPETRLAHTLNANTGAVAVSLCAMAGAVERPFTAGAFPVRAIQQAAMARVVKGICAEFDIPVTRYSVLTHAEIQPTLGIKQRGKWDICWLPGMDAPGDPIEVGDRLRAQIKRVSL